jgi:hypothetical protein
MVVSDPWQASAVGSPELHTGVVGFRSALGGADIRGDESICEYVTRPSPSELGLSPE